MSGDERDLFRSEMSDVVPLRREPRAGARGRGSDTGRDSSLEQRREAAVRDPEADPNRLPEEGIAPLDAWYVLDFKRPGIQTGVFRKLKQGRYEAEARLDLHRMSVARARREIYDFIAESHRLGLRTVLVIHGKGGSSAEREHCSLLKGCTDRWLRELEVVQAFHSAQPRHGGTGAVYVLLRKSEDEKRRTREQFSKGRVPINSP